MTRRRFLPLLAAVAVTVTACTGPAEERSTPAPAAASAVAGLPTVSSALQAAPRIAEDVLPPTNRWYSSLAFSPELPPVYPYPLAVAPHLDGFTVQVPPVTATATTISAGFTDGLSVGFAASELTVVRADPVSVTVAYAEAGTERARVTMAEGSPVVALTATTELDITLGAAPAPLSEDAWTALVDGVTYLLRGAVSVAGATVHVPAGGTLQIAGLPPDGDAGAWADAIGDPVTGVATTFRAASDTVTTRLEYTGTDHTVIVAFAGREGAAPCELGTFDTAYGPATACAATSLEWSVPALVATSAYDFDGLDEATRAALTSHAQEDLAATEALPEDTYYGGKALGRLASLVELGRALDDDALVQAATDRLAEEIAPWTDPDRCAGGGSRCFVYDDALHLVVGREASFGSEEGNDHHFHYGYFLFAAAVLGAQRPELVDGMRPVMDALAADIAAGSAELPALRVFDPYRGHSWASGLSPFADGNDQESSSEAVAAWNGLALWAAAAGENELAGMATWLLSSEADAARALWLEPDATTLPDAYAHTIVSLTWSAKRDYSTWFSAEPSAILGIQTMPLGPLSLQYLGADPARVQANVADAGDAAFTGALGDYVTGYSALAGRAARESAERLIADRSSFDDGWSRALAEAWLAAVRLREG